MEVDNFVSVAEKAGVQCSAEEYQQLDEMLRSMSINADSIGLVCKGLNALAYTRSVPMLAGCWPTIPPQCHLDIERWALHGGDQKQTSSRCVALAGVLTDCDIQFSMKMLTHLFERRRQSKQLPKSAVRVFWLRQQGSPADYPFNRWSSDLLKPDIERWLATAVCEIAGQPTKGGKTTKADHEAQQALTEWLSRLKHLKAEEISCLQGIVCRRKPAPVALTTETESHDHASPPAAPASGPSHVSNAPKDQGDSAGAKLRQMANTLLKLSEATDQEEGKWRETISSALHEAEDLRRQRNALLNDIATLRHQLRDREAALSNASKERDDAVTSLTRVKDEKDRLQKEAADLRGQIENEREASGAREHALTRNAARALAEDIGHSIEHIVKSFRHWQEYHEAPEPVEHLATMVESLLSVLASKDVPLGR